MKHIFIALHLMAFLVTVYFMYKASTRLYFSFFVFSYPIWSMIRLIINDFKND